MGALDFKIDAVSEDFVESDDGWFADDQTASTAIRYQLTHDWNAWFADWDKGSRRREAFQLGDGPVGQQFLQTDDERALGMLVNAGYIADVVVSIVRPQPGRLYENIVCRDLRTGQPLELELAPLSPRS